MLIARWGRRQWRRQLKQIAPFREIGFLEAKTGTPPRLKVAVNNQRAGGRQRCLLGFHLTSNAGATQEPDLETQRDQERAQGPGLLSAPVQESLVTSESTFAQATAFGCGGRPLNSQA